MANVNEIASKILGGLTIVGIGVIGYCYGKKQYYQGRIDATKEMTAAIEKIRDEFEYEKFERDKFDHTK